MSTNASFALRCETDFLSAVEMNLDGAKGRDLRGTIWQRAEHDESDKLRALLAANRITDRNKLKELPANRRVSLHGFERRWFWGKRRTGVAIASVFSPLEHFAAKSDGAPPIGVADLTAHVRQLAGDHKVPHIIGVCSPSGFTDEARSTKLEIPGVTVILVEPDGRGGWRTTAAGESVDPRLLRIFDPESAKQKVERVRRIVEERSADMLTGGVSTSTVARAANLPEEVIRQGFEQLAASDSELRIARHDGEMIMYRGAAVPVGLEKKRMNVMDRIRRLFSSEGDEAEKINLLAERRAALTQRRDRIYDDIVKLEGKEAELFEQGKAATSMVPRRRLAAQLAQLRKDIVRQNTTAAMLNQQINIISTDIHNLTLIQQGQIARLPDTQELTEHAVAAEEMLESLNADAEMVGTLETGMDIKLANADEQAILKEFEAFDQQRTPSAAPPTPIRQPTTPQREASPRRISDPVVEPAPPLPPMRRPADPEPT